MENLIELGDIINPDKSIFIRGWTWLRLRKALLKRTLYSLQPTILF